MARAAMPALLVVLAFALTSCRKPNAQAPVVRPVEENLTAKLRAMQADVAALEAAAIGEFKALQERQAKLTGASPAETEAFQRDAARYQANCDTLKKRQDEIRALVPEEVKYRDNLAAREKQARDALARLRDAIDTNNWAAQARYFTDAFEKYQQTAAFPQISALAQAQFARASRSDIEKAAAARPAVSEAENVTQQIKAIVNQTPPLRPGPVGNVMWQEFHPGAIKPDLKNITMRELTKDRQFFDADTCYMKGAPNVFYSAREMEFNPMTKYFYTDRNKAKRKLSQLEYEMLLKLYHQLGEMENVPAASATSLAAETWARWEMLKQVWPK